MAKTKKPKLQKTLRRQAWDTFKSGYDRKGMDGEPFDIKSTIGNAILGKDREVVNPNPKVV
jgi:predicted GTPase